MGKSLTTPTISCHCPGSAYCADASVLVLTPPDSVKEGEKKSDPRIVELGKQLRDVSAQNGAAFWDFRAAMGGDASFIPFMRRRMASPDRNHLLKDGNQHMAQRLLAALFTGVAARAASVPEAGCPR